MKKYFLSFLCILSGLIYAQEKEPHYCESSWKSINENMSDNNKEKFKELCYSGHDDMMLTQKININYNDKSSGLSKEKLLNARQDKIRLFKENVSIVKSSFGVVALINLATNHILSIKQLGDLTSEEQEMLDMSIIELKDKSVKIQETEKIIESKLKEENLIPSNMEEQLFMKKRLEQGLNRLELIEQDQKKFIEVSIKLDEPLYNNRSLLKNYTFNDYECKYLQLMLTEHFFARLQNKCTNKN